MSHPDHDHLPGYDARQIWVDGCDGCTSLVISLPYSTANLDDFTLCRALNRAEQMVKGDLERTGPISHNERELLIHLHGCVSVMRRLRHIGFSVTDLKP